MIPILAISGSASSTSSNTALLEAIKHHFRKDYTLDIYKNLRTLPLFRPEDLDAPLSDEVKVWKEKINSAEAIIICTPEYTHNIPAVLKNGLEWITASGEIAEKKVLAITFTPHEPRGEWAMQSLLFSLKTLNAKIVAQIPLYKNEVTKEGEQFIIADELADMLEEALALLR